MNPVGSASDPAPCRAAAAHGVPPRALLEEATATAAAAGLVTGAPVPDGLRASRG
jgi:hypothetical protein